jgi:hypothetical protein
MSFKCFALLLKAVRQRIMLKDFLFVIKDLSNKHKHKFSF